MHIPFVYLNQNTEENQINPHKIITNHKLLILIKIQRKTK